MEAPLSTEFQPWDPSLMGSWVRPMESPKCPPKGGNELKKTKCATVQPRVVSFPVAESQL